MTCVWCALYVSTSAIQLYINYLQVCPQNTIKFFSVYDLQHVSDHHFLLCIATRIQRKKEDVHKCTSSCLRIRIDRQREKERGRERKRKRKKKTKRTRVLQSFCTLHSILSFFLVGSISDIQSVHCVCLMTRTREWNAHGILESFANMMMHFVHCEFLHPKYV